MTDAGESPANGDAGEQPPETAAPSGNNLAREERHRRFERVRKLLYWVRRSRVAKRSPDRFLKPIDYLIHVIAQYDDHRRKLSGFRWSDRDEFTVSPSDHVRIPSLFVVELFPPSVIGNLERANKRNRWASRQLRIFPDYVPKLDEARSGDAWSWWNLGAVVRRGSGTIIPDASYGKLPDEFDSVELKALQIGQGITAVMAKFDFNDAAASRLDEYWHREYRAEIHWGRWGGRWPRSLDEDFVAYRRVQEERGRLHCVARQWFSAKCPGFFASNEQPQPLLDILLFDEISAFPEKRPASGVAGAIRALGLPHPHYIQRSSEFPAMILSEADTRSDSDMEDRRTWALWGNRAEILEALAIKLESHGLGQQDSSIAHYVQDAIEDYFLRLSITEMLAVCQARYAAMRDTARQHGQLGRRYLENLRASLLTLSVDLSSIDRDVRTYNARGWRRDHAQFFFEDAPFLVAEHDEHGIQSLEPINLNERLLTDQMRMLETLRAADNDYRGILTAAASLTSSLQSIRLARAAIWVAMASLGVAAVTLLITDISQHSIFGIIADWLKLLAH